MNLERFKLILYDTYQMDIQLPPLIFRYVKDFEEASYTNWAIDELLRYLEKRIPNGETLPISSFIDLVDRFLKKINRCGRVKYKNTKMFIVAHNVMIDILDLLEAMNDEG